MLGIFAFEVRSLRALLRRSERGRKRGGLWRWNLVKEVSGDLGNHAGQTRRVISPNSPSC